MGMVTTVYGSIACPRWKSRNPERLQQLNHEIIESLPSTDTSPFMTRGMFHINESQSRISPDYSFPYGTYQYKLIVFGGTFKGIEYEWDEWLEKFEGLLRKLYWVETFLSLRSTLGHYDYFYRANDTSERFHNNEPPLPVASWEFDGGPREFQFSGPHLVQAHT